MNKKLILILLALFIPIFPYGFEGETIITTPYGKYPIRKLTTHDWVYATDLNQEVIAKRIISITKSYVPHFARIWIGNEYIDAAEYQLFYVASSDKWKQAKDLSTADLLWTLYQEDTIAPTHIEMIFKPTVLYDLCIEGYHNFYVSHQPFLVHNFPAIGICLTWLFGGGTVTFAGVTVTAGAASGAAAAVTAVGVAAGMALSKSGANHDDEPLERSDEEKDKKPGRQKNETTKPEFFKKPEVKENYEYDKATKSHKLKKNGEPIADKNNHHMTWDHTHNDVESFNKNKTHIGSINPDTDQFYKNAVKNRKLNK